MVLPTFSGLDRAAAALVGFPPAPGGWANVRVAVSPRLHVGVQAAARQLLQADGATDVQAALVVSALSGGQSEIQYQLEGVLDGRGNLDAYGLWARGPAAVEAYALISARQASNGVVRTVWRAPRWTGEVSATTDAATLVGTVLRQVGTRWAVGGEVGYSFRDESPGVSVGLRFASAAGTSGTPAAQSAGSAGARWRAGLGVPARQSVGAVSEAAELAEPGAFVVTAAASHMGHVVASFAKRLLQPGLAAGAQYYYNYYSQSSSLAVGVAFGSAGFCWQVCADTSKVLGVSRQVSERMMVAVTRGAGGWRGCEGHSRHRQSERVAVRAERRAGGGAACVRSGP
eukprot:TRINITY_DN4010_c0_g1_i1.p1 TRINITY_DN4010_c0_g1~~TRINITY_DN4010_c0_g1_i1.p1  ORF type:complete len:343 (+),score=48.68 TRINITY_DN4010_c0_g1_i1:3-1031(+)